MASAYISVSSTSAPDTQAGSPVAVRVRVANTSPILGMTLTNVFLQAQIPAILTSVTWTASYLNGATGAASGTGSVVLITSLPAGSYVDVTYSVTPPAGLYDVSYTIKSTVSVADPQVILNNDTSASATFDVLKPVVALTFTKTGPVSIKRGEQAQFTVTINNTSAEDITDALFVDDLPANVFFESFGVSTGAGYFNPFTCIPSGTVTLAAGQSITIPINVIVGVNACVGAASNTASLTLPSGFVLADGSNCLYTSHDFAITNITAVTHLKITGCVRSLCLPAVNDPGYATVELITPGGCSAYHPVNNQAFVFSLMKFDFTNGCFETCDLPVNNHIGSCGDAAVPTYYSVKMYSAPTTGATTLVAVYVVRLLNSMAGLVDVSDFITDDNCERC